MQTTEGGAARGKGIQLQHITFTVLFLDKMAELFLKNKSTISRHIKNVFEEKELDKSSTVAIFATVQMEGKKKNDIFALVNIKINYVKIRRNKIIICAI